MLTANAPFTPGADHSTIVDDGQRMDPDNFHQYRGPDGLPRLDALSPVIASAKRLHIERRAIRVRTDPGALVAAWANQLGSFASGAPGIVVRADANGIAVIDAMTGNDVGGYPILVASPARSGVVVFTLNAE